MRPPSLHDPVKAQIIEEISSERLQIPMTVGQKFSQSKNPYANSAPNKRTPRVAIASAGAAITRVDRGCSTSAVLSGSWHDWACVCRRCFRSLCGPGTRFHKGNRGSRSTRQATVRASTSSLCSACKLPWSSCSGAMCAMSGIRRAASLPCQLRRQLY